MMLCLPSRCVVASPFKVVAPQAMDDANNIFNKYPAATIQDPFSPSLPEQILSEALQNPKLQRLLDEQAQETEAPSDDDDEQLMLSKEINAARNGLHAARQRKFKLLCEEEDWASVEGTTADLKVQIQGLQECREAVVTELSDRRAASDRMIFELECSASDLRRRCSTVDDQDVKNSEMLARLAAKAGALLHERDALRRIVTAKTALADLHQALESARRQKEDADSAAEVAQKLLEESSRYSEQESSYCDALDQNITDLQLSVKEEAKWESDQIQGTQDLWRKSELLEKLCDWHRQHPDEDDLDDDDWDEVDNWSSDVELVEGDVPECQVKSQFAASRRSANTFILALVHVSPLLASWLVSAWWLCSGG